MKNSMLWRAGGSSGHRAGNPVYGRERGAASAGGGCTARGHRPWPDGNRYRGDVCRRRGGGGGGRAIRGLRDRLTLVSKVYPRHAGGRRCAAPVKTVCAGCRPTIWICISCTGGAISPAGDGRGDGKAGGRGQNPPLGRLQSGHRRYAGAVAHGGRRTLRHQPVLYHLASRGIEYDLLPGVSSTPCR